MEEVYAADKAVAEDAANAHHLQTTCKTKRRDAVDVATTGVSQSHQEGRENWANQQRKRQHTRR